MSGDDLVTWLRAQFDVDEAHARKDLWALDRSSNGGDWEAHYGYNHPRSYLKAAGQDVGNLTVSIPGLPDGGDDQHAMDAFLVARMVGSARSRATRALAEVAAKRALLDWLDLAEDWMIDKAYGGQPDGDVVRRGFAAAYADRPGYRSEWTPKG